MNSLAFAFFAKWREERGVEREGGRERREKGEGGGRRGGGRLVGAGGVHAVRKQSKVRLVLEPQQLPDLESS